MENNLLLEHKDGKIHEFRKWIQNTDHKITQNQQKANPRINKFYIQLEYKVLPQDWDFEEIQTENLEIKYSICQIKNRVENLNYTPHLLCQKYLWDRR